MVTKQKQAELNGQVETSNKIIKIDNLEIVKVPLTAKDYEEYDRRTTSQGSLADEWVLYKAFKINGEGVTEEHLKGMKARDRIKVSSIILKNPKVICHDNLPATESGDFTIKGNRFTEKENSGDHISSLIAKIKSEPYEGVRWGIKNMFLMNNQPIKDKHFELPAPEGIGFEAMSNFFKLIYSLLATQED